MKIEDIKEEEIDFQAMLDESFREKDSKSDLINARIVSIDLEDNQAMVDVGRKNESYLSLDELKDEDDNLIFEKDDEITVAIIGSKGDRLLISYKVALKKVALAEFIEDYNPEEEYIIEGEIIKKNKGGFIVKVDEFEFFMPLTLSYINPKVNFVGKQIKAIIVSVDKDKGNVVISRKKLIERYRDEIQTTIDKLLESKSSVIGKIKKITSFGMFIDIGGIDGLAHYSEISHKGPVNPSKYYKEGDEVNVVVIDYNSKKRHLSLSIKQATIDPWKNIDYIIKHGDIINGTVSNIESYGAFIDLKDDLEAFLHISEISWDKNVQDPKDYISIGDKLDVEIIEIDKIKKRLRASIKSQLPKPISIFTKKNRTGNIVKGVITSIIDFGAFVKIDNIEGLLHNQEISWDKSKTAKSTLEVGQEVDVKIIYIDKENNRVSLSLKALEESPILNFSKKHKVGDVIEGKVKDVKDFGLFISIEENIDALIRLEDLYPLKEDEIEKDQVIEAMIVFIDLENNKIRASVKKLDRLETKKAINESNKNEYTDMTLGDRFDKKQFNR